MKKTINLFIIRTLRSQQHMAGLEEELQHKLVHSRPNGDKNEGRVDHISGIIKVESHYSETSNRNEGYIRRGHL